jgi:ferritin-like metal-binding protein YciE
VSASTATYFGDQNDGQGPERPIPALKDIYFAEKQIYKSLPKMAKVAASGQLRAAFEKRHGETEVQIERLEQIFELLGKPARGKTCDDPGDP